MGLSRGGHNLDFIIEKDSIGFGYEVKLAMQIIAMADQKCGEEKQPLPSVLVKSAEDWSDIGVPSPPNLKSKTLNVD